MVLQLAGNFYVYFPQKCWRRVYGKTDIENSDNRDPFVYEIILSLSVAVLNALFQAIRDILFEYIHLWPILVAVRSKAYVCSR